MDTIFLNIKEASNWASQYLGRNVSTSNISYLLNYGRISKYIQDGNTLLSKEELEKYYTTLYQREQNWKKKLGDDLNWDLSFDNLTERETTKHVHRLHPYKGKFIPQLVQYFLDEHTDSFKQEVYFHKGDIVLDPFCGSGTTLVEANELGINAIGIDVSSFNTLISNCKVMNYNLQELKFDIDNITNNFQNFVSSRNNIIAFDKELTDKLYSYNNTYFPVPDFKRMVQQKHINAQEYGIKKSEEFLPIYNSLLKKYNITLYQQYQETFLYKWYIKSVREEIDFIFEEIKKVSNNDNKKILTIILSRTIRSCRATTHSDLATLKEPVTTPYYCTKHGKICKPLFSILKWWQTYSKDTLKRLEEFANIKTNTIQLCLNGDSREVNIIKEISQNRNLSNIFKNRKIQGVFSSPPYIGLIDYHEQHAYAYDLFGFKRNDNLEIGPLFKGQGTEAKKSYVDGIAGVLNNIKQFLVEDYNVFLVANDKYNLYPAIAEKASMKIVNQFKRPVLNRTERDKSAYSEIIFNLKKQ